MALFNSKKDKKVEKKEAASEVEAKEKATSKEVGSFQLEASDYNAVLLRPRITEKATDHQQNNVYTFEVNADSTKKSISEAFRKIYKVNPIKVNITKNPAKKVWLRGRVSTKKGVKKAHVYLREGDKIDLV